MATDYDAPRDKDAEDDAASLEELRAQSAANAKAAPLEIDEANLLEDLELPGADLSGETLTVAVIPIRPDEFRCEKCFLVAHNTRRAKPGVDVCNDCA